MDKVFGSVLPYDGESDPNEFLRQFCLQASMFGWDDNRKAAIIQHYLVDKAKGIYDALDNDKKGSIDEISRALKTGCVQSQEALMSAFYGRKPLPSENLSQYGRAIQKLLMKAIPGMVDPAKTLLLRTQLMQHVPQNVRDLIKFNPKQTWDELLISLEDLAPNSNAYTAYSGANFEYQIKQEPLDVNYASTSSQRSFKGACFYCKKPGHRISNCYKRHSDETRGKSRSSYGFSDQNRSASKFSKTKETSVNVLDMSEDDCLESNLFELVSRGQMGPKNKVGCAYDVLDMNPVACGAPLITKSVCIAFGNQNENLITTALLDGGATNSLIRIGCLSKSFQNTVRLFKRGDISGNLYGLSRQKFIIKGVTGSVMDDCVVVNAKVKIDDWYGSQVFVLTDRIVEKDVILGRDFLKSRNVTIRHGDDVVSIPKCNDGDARILIKSPVFESNQMNKIKCVLNQTVVVPARSQLLATCRVPGAKPDDVVLFTPEASTESLQPALCVATVSNQITIPVCLMNTSTKEILVECDHLVGHVKVNSSPIENKKNNLSDPSVQVNTQKLEIESGKSENNTEKTNCVSNSSLGVRNLVSQDNILPFWLYENEDASFSNLNPVRKRDVSGQIRVGSPKKQCGGNDDGNKNRVERGIDISGGNRNGRNGGDVKNDWDGDVGIGRVDGGDERKGIGVVRVLSRQDSSGSVKHLQRSVIQSNSRQF